MGIFFFLEIAARSRKNLETSRINAHSESELREKLSNFLCRRLFSSFSKLKLIHDKIQISFNEQFLLYFSFIIMLEESTTFGFAAAACCDYSESSISNAWWLCCAALAPIFSARLFPPTLHNTTISISFLSLSPKAKALSLVRIR